MTVAGTTQSSVTVLSPNGGEQWQVGNQRTITWSAPNYTGLVDLQLCQDNLCAEITQNLTSNTGSYNWTIPSQMPGMSLGAGNVYKIEARIFPRGMDKYALIDSSDAPFSILSSGTINIPSLTVLSPNGGESWAKGTTQTISWNYVFPNRCLNGAPCITAPTIVPVFDITLISYAPPCITNICPKYPTLSRTIANSVYGSSYQWTIPSDLSEGSYTIQITQTGTTVYDASDSAFKITSGTTYANTPPQINISSNGTIPPVVGQSISFGWVASDADNDDLVWNVD
jgi:hypothetical protein